MGLLRSHIVKTLCDMKIKPTIAYECIRIYYIIIHSGNTKTSSSLHQITSFFPGKLDQPTYPTSNSQNPTYTNK
jgi:hypothetical protein